MLGATEEANSVAAARRVVRGFGLSVIQQGGQYPQGKLQVVGSIKSVEEKSTAEGGG
jgi:hypothetical protein